MNKHNNVKFENGELLNHTDKATYLGGILTKYVNANTEIQNRIAFILKLAAFRWA